MRNDYISFLVDAGIYKTLKISEDDIFDLVDFFTGVYSIDAYCQDCGATSIFKKSALPEQKSSSIKAIRSNINNAKSSLTGSPNNFISDQFRALINLIDIQPLNFICSRNYLHEITIFILLKGDSMIKVGQYPSPIDITTKIPSKYSALLGSYFKEYKSAIQLETHNYHVGAYAYLRRIIEKLTEEAHQYAIKDPNWNEELFIQKQHFDEKIKSLKNYLPEFFTSNVTIYNLISKGIHELSEEECKDMYPILKNAIDYTLEEIIEKRQQEIKKTETSNAITKLGSKYKNK